MALVRLPASAAWRHETAREGFEVVRFDGSRARGTTTGVEDAAPFVVGYDLGWDDDWRARSAVATDGDRSVRLEHDGAGHWLVDGEPADHLDGCLDVDLESSALTNAFPVHRLALAVRDTASAPAAYVTRTLGVERLEQTYRRLDDGPEGQRYAYRAPVFDFSCELSYDAHGLVLVYPGLARRVA